MQRRLVEPGELQPGIKRRSAVAVFRQRLGIAGSEILAHRAAPLGIVDNDKAPWLAQTDRRREAGEIVWALEGAIGGTLGAKAPDVAPPDQQFAQSVAKRRIERAGAGDAHPAVPRREAVVRAPASLSRTMV